jgi:hypothetical protein
MGISPFAADGAAAADLSTAPEARADVRADVKNDLREAFDIDFSFTEFPLSKYYMI